jgi:hypothetical protein
MAMTAQEEAYRERVKRLYPKDAVYGRLTVVSHERQADGKWFVLCTCACGGNYVSKHPCHLGKLVNSCGCLNRELARARRLGKAPKNKLPSGQGALGLAFRSYRVQALRRKLAFELTLDQFELISSQNCRYCGDPPKTHPKVGRYHGSALYNGIDRVKNTDGYTASNCVPCCTRCNKAKCTDSAEEFTSWLKRASTFVTRSLP